MEKDLPERGSWCLYILRCGDDSLYTGVTIDLPRRGGRRRAGRTADAVKFSQLVLPTPQKSAQMSKISANDAVASLSTSPRNGSKNRVPGFRENRRRHFHKRTRGVKIAKTENIN